LLAVSLVAAGARGSFDFGGGGALGRGGLAFAGTA
jgi:hypothetical protein